MNEPVHSRRLLWGSLAFWVFALAYLCLSYVLFRADCAEWSNQAEKPANIEWQVSEREAIVVLTGDWGRIPRAVELLRERGSPLLIVSGAGKGISKKDLVNQQGDAATYIHETWERILVESKSKTTIENAENTAAILSKRYVDRVILVTSDYHMTRSLKVFEQVFPSVEYFALPVVSGITPLFTRDATIEFSSRAKLFVEFWKHFLFVHFYQFTL